MTKQILSYHSDAAFKRRFVRQIDAHKRADSIVQGLFGRMNGKFRGCAVGCSIHSLDRIDGRKTKRDETEYGDHSLLSKRLGIPLELAYLEDRIFERLPMALAKEWPGKFSRAIPVGRDLANVWPGFAIWLLTDEKFGVLQYATGAAAKAIEDVAALYRRELLRDKPTREEWIAARNAADAAADAAAHAAAYAAAAAAYAAADAAYAYAAAAADAAAHATADAAARKTWWKAAADKLVSLMTAPANRSP